MSYYMVDLDYGMNRSIYSGTVTESGYLEVRSDLDYGNDPYVSLAIL